MKVLIKRDVYRKIMYWVNKSDYEVSGLGLLSYDKPNQTFIVEDAILLKQKNTSSHTDIEAEDVNRAMFELRDSPGDLKFWWHSHVNMDVFWSGTDKDTIEKIGQAGWFLSTVFNKKHERRSALYVVNGQATPFGVSPLFLDEIPTEIEKEFNPHLEAWEKEYSDKVVNLPDLITKFPRYWDDDYAVAHKGYSRFGHTGPYVQPDRTMHDPLPETRPEGMTKKEWKRLKRMRKQSVINMSPSEAEVQGEETEEPLTEHDLKLLDSYGFTEEQWRYLSSVGASVRDIDDYFHQGYDAVEVLDAYGFEYEGVEIDELEEEISEEDTKLQQEILM